MARIVSLTDPTANTPGGLTFSGGSVANRVRIDGGSAFTVNDLNATASAPVRALPPCFDFNEDPTLAVCPTERNGQTVTSYTLLLRGGDDAFFNADFLSPLTNGFVGGGTGNDGLNTGSAPTDDRLFGEDGNDSIQSSGGSDVLRGNDGNDSIFAVDDARSRGDDRVFCDAGTDRAVVDLRDFVSGFAGGCEVIQRAAIDQHPLVRIARRIPRVRDGRAKLELRCPKRATSRCQGKLTLTRTSGKDPERLGRARYSIPRGERQRVSVGVGEVSGRAKVTATARERDPDGEPKITTVQTRLRG